MIQTKSKKMFVKLFLALKTFLSIFFLGSSVFASWFSTTTKTLEVPQKQDLSVFVDRLSDRLKGVFWEIVDLSQWIVAKNWLSNQNVKSIQNYDSVQIEFVDISNSPYKYSIEKLVGLWVIDSSRTKFYPDNYLRRYEMLIMMVKYSLSDADQQIPQVVFSNRGWFSDVAQNTSYAAYLAYAEQNNMVGRFITYKDQKKVFSPNSFVYEDEVCEILKLSCTDIDHIKISRGKFVELLVSGDIDSEIENTDVENLIATSWKADYLSNSLAGRLGTMFAIVR